MPCIPNLEPIPQMKTECSKKVVGYRIKAADGSLGRMATIRETIAECRAWERLNKRYPDEYKVKPRLVAVWGDK